jgi:15-cis-phytoene desaturase
LWLDRKITGERFWANLWRPDRLNYDFYDLTRIRPGWERRPSVSRRTSSTATARTTWTTRQIARATLREAAEFAPAAAQARILHADVHRIPMAIACPKPGTEEKRPAARTRIPG